MNTNIKTGDLLSFQDYSPDNDRSARIEVEAVHGNTYGNPTTTSVNFNNYDLDMRPNNQFQNDPSPEAEQPKNHNFWTIEYYQKYFDVQSSDVVERIVSSIVPQKVSPNYFDSNIRAKPDLYGPIWISVTLIFAIGISGNIASYLQSANKLYHWRYDFHLVSYAASAIFFYVWMVPVALWAALKWTTTEDTEAVIDEEHTGSPSIMALFCLYGYSLSIYIPVSILWTIQVSWLQWSLVLTAAFVSGAVLVFWLLPALRRSRYFFILVDRKSVV